MLLFYIVTKQIKPLIVAVDKLPNSFVIEYKRSQPLSDSGSDAAILSQGK